MSPKAGAELTRDLVEEAAEVRPEPPRPLMREVSPAHPFPVDALGSILGPAAYAINDRIQAPHAICGQSVLAVACLAVQAQADVELPIGCGREKPVSNFFVTVAASGERKSASDTEATWPIRRREETLRESYDNGLPSYTNDKTAWDKSREAATRRAKGDRSAIRQALEDIGLEPPAPLIPLLTCPEPTFEGLSKLFAIGQPSLGVFAAEGGQFIGGHGMSEDNKLKTAAGLSDIWDGGIIRRVRGGDGTLILPGRRVSVHLMAQPGVADILFRDRMLTDQGLLSRMLVTAPDTAAGTRLYRKEQPGTDATIKRYGACLLSILERPQPLTVGKTNELKPRKLPLSSRARAVWVAFADHVERSIAPDGELSPIAGLANKLAEHAARLASVLALVRDIEAAEIAAEDMAAGIVLAQHYAAEALRLFGTSSINPDLRLARQALDWMLSPRWGKPAISLPDLYQRGPNAIRENAVARKIVDILVDHGWLVRIAQGTVVEGVRRREAWRIVRG
jgi:hypothetical protein